MLQRQNAAEVLVQVGDIGSQRDCETRGLLRLGVPTLLAQRMSKQAQMIDAARVRLQVIPTQLLGPCGIVPPQRLECGHGSRVAHWSLA